MKTKKENKVPKKTVGVPLSESLYEALLDVCADYGANIATVIRMIIVDYMKRYKNYSIISERKEEK